MQREYLRYWLFTSLERTRHCDEAGPTFVFKAFDPAQAYVKARDWFNDLPASQRNSIIRVWVEEVFPDAIDMGQDPTHTEHCREIYSTADALEVA